MLRLYGPVLTATAPTTLNTLSVQSAADYVVAHTGQVLHATTTHKNHRVLLEVVAFAANVGVNFNAIGQPYPANLPQRRVWFFGSHGTHLNAYPTALRATWPPLNAVAEGVLHPMQRRSFGSSFGGATPLSDQLVYRRHKSTFLFISRLLDEWTNFINL